MQYLQNLQVSLRSIWISIILILAFFLFSLSSNAAPIITGNATADFSTLPGVNVYNDALDDIGVPAIIGTNENTGWNISKTYVWYDVTTDKLYVAIQCTKICGDADGDGFPGGTSPTLAGIPGSDTDWGPGETGAFIINTNALSNVNFNIIVGKRTNLNGISNWGIYYFDKLNEINGGVDSNWLDPDITDPVRPPFIASSTLLAATHDLEFVINDFSTLYGINKSNMKIGVFMGSSTDDGIGEDTLAGQGTPFSVQKLTVIKQVVNDDGGTKTISDFPLSVDNGIGAVTSNVGVSALTATPYTISETLQDGYMQTSLTCVDDVSHLAVAHPVVLSPGQNVTCTIVNDDIAPKLKVIKNVINDNGGTKVVADFLLSVDKGVGIVLSGVQNVVKAGVTYVVSETSSPGYAMSGPVCVDDITNLNVSPLVLNAGQTVTCTITNNDVKPELTVVKKVINDDGGTKTISDFPLFVNAVPVTSGIQTMYNAGIPLTVSETQQAGYTMTSLECKENVSLKIVPNPVILETGKNVTCTITNDDNKVPPNLTIIKKVINDNGGTKTISDFPLFVDGNSVVSGQKNVSSILIPHIVSETKVYGYVQKSITCVDDSTLLNVAHPVILTSGQNVTCTIINDDIAPSIQVMKNVINDNGGTKTLSDFNLSINPSVGDIHIGTTYYVNSGVEYSISETPSNGYLQTSVKCEDISIVFPPFYPTKVPVSYPVKLIPGQDVQCTVTNDDIAPKLTVIKKVINDNGGTKTVTDFPLFVDGASVISGVQNISKAITPHTVTETQQTGYTQTSIVCTDDVSHSTVAHPVVLGLAQNVTCTITNDDKPADVCVKDDESYKDVRNCKPTAPTCLKPGIIVKKVVVNDNGGNKKVSDFKLSVDNAQVVSGTDNTFALGVPHTVSEVGLAGYKQTSITCIDLQTKLQVPNPVVLAANQVVKCTIINDDIAPHITVVKKVINNDGGKKLPADFTLLVDGKVVKTGVSNVYKANVSHSVSENSMSGYKQTSLICKDDNSGATVSNPVMLKPGQNVTCTITNDDVVVKTRCDTRFG